MPSLIERERRVRTKLIEATNAFIAAERAGYKKAARMAKLRIYRYRHALVVIKKEKTMPNRRIDGIRLLFNTAPGTLLELDTGETLHAWGLMTDAGDAAMSIDGMSDEDVLLAYDDFIDCGMEEYAE